MFRPFATLRSVALVVALAPLVGCFSARPSVPDGVAKLDVAWDAFDTGNAEGAAILADEVRVSDDSSKEERAEAAWIAGEAHLALENHREAFLAYRYVLENAPWHENIGDIEDRLIVIGEAFLNDSRYGGTFFADRGRGVEAYETLQAHFRRSDRADDALLAVADYFARDDVRDYIEAALAYERLVEEYPDSEWVEKAVYSIGHVRLLASQGAKYDRDDLLRAKASLQRSLDEHPKGVFAQRSAADLATIDEELARSEVLVADFYLSRGRQQGEVVRLANAALLYPHTPAGQEAEARLIAYGVDLDTLADDPTRQSLDAVRPGELRFEEERRSVFGFGF